MAHHQLKNDEEARDWFDKAVAWTHQKAPTDAQIRAAWTEAAELLGMPKPDVIGSDR
jgi:hypothetical protein